MEMNKGEAEKCRDIGKKYLRAGNYKQAAKFFEKSHRMYPLPGVEMMRERALEELNKASAGASAPTSPRTGGHHASGHGARRRENAAAAPAASSGRAEESSRPYTAGQVQIVNKIRACKNHYEVLSVPQVADENEIKKAYRKVGSVFSLSLSCICIDCAECRCPTLECARGGCPHSYALVCFVSWR